MAISAIKTTSLAKYYGKNRGIAGVDLDVQEGEIFGFIGPNGAGKSTTIKLLLNFIFPTSGAAQIFGMDCVHQSAAIKRGVGYVPAEVRGYEEQRVWRVLKFGASFVRGKGVQERLFDLCELFEVETDKKMRQLSTGNKKKVALVQALLAQPALLILDEPTSGLDPLMRHRLFSVLEQENEQGMTVFMSSHNLDEVQQICGRVAVIKEGSIITTSSLQKVRRARGSRVQVHCEALTVDMLERIGATDIQLHEARTDFRYAGDMDALVRMLAALHISGLRIEEDSLDEAFMRFYSQQGEDEA
nr:ABC transporter ATP-binding protein [Maliibacterium massiliense]